MGVLRSILRHAPRAVLLLGGLAIAIWGARFVRTGEHAMAGWTLIGLSGASAPFLVRRITRPLFRPAIDERGIFDPSFDTGRIPWSRIEGAHVLERPFRDDIYLEFRHPDGRRGELRLDLSGAGASTAELLELIVTRSGQEREETPTLR